MGSAVDGATRTRRSARLLLALSALSGALVLTPASALAVGVTVGYPLGRQAVLSVAGSGQEFGSAVAMSSSLIAVGAPRAGTGGSADVGAVYVFERPRAGWSGRLTATAELMAPRGTIGGEMGTALAVSGATIVAGAPKAGAVEVFTEPARGWHGAIRPTVRLTAPGGTAGDAFGSAVATSGRIVVVGAPDAGVSDGPDSGAAYVFTRPARGWRRRIARAATLLAGTPSAGDSLGTAVAIAGRDVAVGAPGNDPCEGDTAGSVELYAPPRTGWRGAPGVQATLQGGLQLGTSLAASATTIVAGAPNPCDKYYAMPGQVSVFARPAGGWRSRSQPTATLEPPDNIGLGGAVALSGSTILAVGEREPATATYPLAPDQLGAPQGPTTASLFAFTRPASGWASTTTATATLAPSAGAPNGSADALALDGDMLLWGTSILATGPGLSGVRSAATLAAPAGAGFVDGGFSRVVIDGTDVFAVGGSVGVPGEAISVFHRQGARWRSQTPVATLQVLGSSPVIESLAADRTTVVAGVQNGIAKIGTVYVFSEPAGGWHGTIAPSAILTPSDGTSGTCPDLPLLFGPSPAETLFGQAVAVAGDDVFVGSPCAEAGGHPGQGAVDVFVQPADGWSGVQTETARLTVATGATGNAFGASLAVAGRTLVASAPGIAKYSGGGVFAFTEPAGGWASSTTPSASLAVPSTAGGALAGPLVIAGDTIVLALPGLSSPTEANPAVLLYDRPAGGWAGTIGVSGQVTAPRTTALAYFDGSLAFTGATLALLAGTSFAGGPIELAVLRRPARGWSGRIALGAPQTFTPALGGPFGTIALENRTAVIAGTGALYVTTLPELAPAPSARAAWWGGSPTTAHRPRP